VELMKDTRCSRHAPPPMASL